MPEKRDLVAQNKKNRDFDASEYVDSTLPYVVLKHTKHQNLVRTEGQPAQLTLF